MVDGQVPCTMLMHTNVYAHTHTHMHACVFAHAHALTCDTHRIHAHKHMHTYDISSLCLSCIVYELLASIIMLHLLFVTCNIWHYPLLAPSIRSPQMV